VVYNTVVNKPTAVPNPRPDYVRSTNWLPLSVGTDDILSNTATKETA
jgi:ectoine hydroxylase